MEEEFFIRPDPTLTTYDGTRADPEDAQKLHEWPDSLADPDEPVTVAIMDSGIHEELDDHPWFVNASVAERKDVVGNDPGADEVGHGSGCASIYARNTPAVEFYDVRIFGNRGRTSFKTIEKAYHYLIDHADEIDVVNMSWGARRDVPRVNNLHEKLIDAGVHDVVAAGNTGGDGGSPATSPSAFSAGAVDKHGNLTRFSSSDPEKDNPDVAALGKDVVMARAPGTSMGRPIDDQFTKASGTSFSAPYTGAAYVNALYTRRGSWDQPFEKHAANIPDTPRDGEGVLKLAPALEEPPEDEPPEVDGSIEVMEIPFVGQVAFMDRGLLANGSYKVVSKQEQPDRYRLIALRR